jgi:hypothetical protein
MKKTYSVLAAFAVTSLVWYSCKKTEKKEGNTDISGKNALFSDLRYTPQRFTVEAGRDTVIFGADSTMIHFYRQSFEDANGNWISAGKVGVELIEMYETGDMILNRASTETGDNKILQSSGQVRIKAVMNGRELYANRYGIAFRAKFKVDSMSLYYGNTNNEDSVVRWTQSEVNLGTRSVPSVPDSSIGWGYGNGLYYFFDSCTSFEFVNADRYFGLTGVETSMGINYDTENFPREATSVFLSFPEINSVVPFISTRKYPLGMKYVFVIIAKKEDNYYFDMQSGTITENMTVKLVPSPETRYNIKARLAGIQ